MQNHELLRRVSTALSLSEADLAELVTIAGLGDAIPEPAGLIREPGTEGAVPCDDATFVALLDALIVARRGPRQGPPPPVVAPSNNLVLKKLRVALGYQDADMLAIFARSGVEIGRNQLGALFRSPENKHYQACSDGWLICFLTGLKRSLEA